MDAEKVTDPEKLAAELELCCLKDNCGKCMKEQCLIGYCKKNLQTAVKQGTDYIDGGVEGIPYRDTKVYDNAPVIHTLGYLLNMCRNCNAYHDEDCIINVLRSALEVIVLGDHQEYKGSVLMYLADIKKINGATADKIFQAFQSRKN